MIKEFARSTLPGGLFFVGSVVVIAGSVAAIPLLMPQQLIAAQIAFGVVAVIAFVCLFGLFIVNPNAPEIAQAMLQRQQAGAIIAARQLIVQGAVGMVENALEMLAKNNVVELDEERKASMVSNLLVVLCGERGTQPVVNTGTIYR